MRHFPQGAHGLGCGRAGKRGSRGGERYGEGRPHERGIDCKGRDQVRSQPEGAHPGDVPLILRLLKNTDMGGFRSRNQALRTFNGPLKVHWIVFWNVL